MEITLLVVIAVCVLLAIAVVAAKVGLARRAEATRRTLAPLRADLLCVAAGFGYAYADVEPRPNGGSWYGYTLGTIALLLPKMEDEGR